MNSSMNVNMMYEISVCDKQAVSSRDVNDTGLSGTYSSRQSSLVLYTFHSDKRYDEQSIICG